MSLQVEKLEKNMAKLTIEVSSEEFEKAMQAAYQKNRGKINVPGFRKGKAPQQMIEKMYGAGIFYEDAANALIPDAYDKAATESGLDIVSRPEIDIVQIEKGKAFIFTAEVAVKPEVTLGKYKGIKVDKISVEVTEDEVNAEIDKAREQNARIISVEDRAVKDGDITVIDFEGFVDGVAFEGGKGENHNLTIGSGQFIPGFEDQLIGVELGKEVDVNVTFPEEYHAEDLAGKPAVFKVTVKEIKEKQLPELDEDFVQDVCDFDTVDEYKASVEAKIKERKEAEAKSKKEDAVIEKIVEDAKMEIPDAMLDTQVRQMAEDFAMRIQQQGLSLEQYFKFTGLTPEAMKEQMEPTAMKRIQTRLVLEAIVEAEKIEVSDEEFNEEIEKMAKMYQMEVDKLNELMGDAEKANMKTDLAVQKAVDFVVNAAKEA